jgi:hypothetical protein
MFVVLPLNPYRQKDVLKQFFAVVMVTRHAPKKRQQRIGIPPHQGRQILPTSFFDKEHQIFIGRQMSFRQDISPADPGCAGSETLSQPGAEVFLAD